MVQMHMHILGISCFYHDSAACLLRDGRLVAAAEEERFTRRKHDSSFPLQSIRYCLAEANVNPYYLDCIGFYELPFLKFERILSSYIGTFPRSFGAYVKAMHVWLRRKLRIEQLIRTSLGYTGPIKYVGHHLSHAASAFLVSPFEESAILTLDGVGEWATSTYGVGNGSTIQVLKEMRFPHSIGLLYSAFTAHLGFDVNEGEYKVMGLAAYGEPKFYQKIRRLIDIKPDGSFQLDMSYFGYHYSLHSLSARFKREFGPHRTANMPVESHHADLAASIQKVTEEVILTISRHVRSQTGLSNLCLAGGVALNGLANARVLRESGFSKVFVQPAAGDAGGALGVACYLAGKLGDGHGRQEMTHAYLGPAFDDKQIRSFLAQEDIQFTEMEPGNLPARVAALIATGHVVGWFQGRMEFGPRALGSRSILADARNPGMQDILNTKIKHREQFRPFAPSVMAEYADEYFEIDRQSPYMLLIVKVRADKVGVIPAVVHVDGTARIQTIAKDQNQAYYALIQAFYELTGVPIIINTSFNVRGEPIVCTPRQAFNCFATTDMDYLVLGSFLVEGAAKKQLLGLEVSETLPEEVII